MEGEKFDEIYIQQWQQTMSRCRKSLERYDLKQVEEIESPQTVRQKISELRSGYSDNAASSELAMLVPSLAHLEKLSSSFVTMLESHISVSIFWGLLWLDIRLASQTENALFRVARMLKVFGHKAELFNGHSSSADLHHKKEIATEVHMELLLFLSEVVKFFRGGTFDHNDDEAWRPLNQQYKVTIQAIDEAFGRIERLSKLAKCNHQAEELAKFQSLLSITPETFSENVKLPCIVLPAVRNTRFFDRDAYMAKIDEIFHAKLLDDTSGDVRSVAFQTSTAIAQSFSEIAIRLQIPNAKPQQHTENRVLVLSWLQRTVAKWLIIFDNAEDANLLLEYWPMASRGSIIITTRNHALAFEPAEAGIEVAHFDPSEGSGFLIHLLSMDIANDLNNAETQSALELSERLSGHALAISQMAGLIHRRAWSIGDFIRMYDKNMQKFLTSTGRGAGLDTVWKLSFESLDRPAFSLLGIMSWLMPDEIPYALFETSNPSNLPESLSFLLDEFDFSEVVETLLNLSLIKKDRTTRNFSLHRLVQTQFRYHMSVADRQESFGNAAKRLNAVFPAKPRVIGQMYNLWERCQKYLQHVLSLVEQYKRESVGQQPLKPTLDFIQLATHCARYLLEIGSYVELANIVNVARDSYNAWDDRAENPLMLALILVPTSTMWLHRSDLELSENLLKDVIGLYETYGSSDPINFIGPYNNMGNATASTNKYDEAVEWYTKKPGVLRKLGYARIHSLRHCFEEARDVWTQHDHAPTHVFHGACVYKIGCTALDLGQNEESITALEHAVVISGVQKHQLTSEYARSVFKLSMALRTRPTAQLEADSWKSEVERLYRELRKDTLPEQFLTMKRLLTTLCIAMFPAYYTKLFRKGSDNILKARAGFPPVMAY
ncbi:hypothetical protein CLAIMM_04795 [Cladophialophora immunda]|nr:hypothetical protein CLAIMM_04795 [Cladophialophora immunda]